MTVPAFLDANAVPRHLAARALIRRSDVDRNTELVGLLAALAMPGGNHSSGTRVP